MYQDIVLLGIFAVVGYGCYYLLKLRAKRKNSIRVNFLDIPDFLRGEDKSINDNIGDGRINGRDIPMLGPLRK